MSDMDNTDKATPNARTVRGADESSDPTVNVSRRNIVKASLATGPIIMTVVSRPVSAGGLYNSMDLCSDAHWHAHKNDPADACSSRKHSEVDDGHQPGN